MKKAQIEPIEPYLIQRGTFKDIPDDQIVGFDSLIGLSYMGSAEYEFSTVPEALSAACIMASPSMVTTEGIVDSKGQPLSFLAPAESRSEVMTVVTRLFTESHPYRLKEPSYCYEHLHGKDEYYLRTNFWWDLSNNWMACFGDNMRRLCIGLGKVCIRRGLPNIFDRV